MAHYGRIIVYTSWVCFQLIILNGINTILGRSHLENTTLLSINADN